MDIQQIEKILQLIEKTNFNEVEIEVGDDLRIKLRIKVVKQSPLKVVSAVTPQPTLSTPSAAETKKNERDNHIAVKPPLPGIFYSKPSPNDNPFVKVGDIVKNGQKLCIIESMKMMNTIEAEVDGKIVDIKCKDGERVDCATELFLIDTTGGKEKKK